VAQFRPALTHLEQDLTATLGEPVIIDTRISPTYDLAISRLAKDEVDFARFGPASYVLSNFTAACNKHWATNTHPPKNSTRYNKRYNWHYRNIVNTVHRQSY
jgi:ABC-type phosphate/phosphonate transport system substrate-binding protein